MPKSQKDEEQQEAAKEGDAISEPDKVESESPVLSVELPDSPIQNLEPDTFDNVQEKVISDTTPSNETESGEPKEKAIEAPEVDAGGVIPEESRGDCSNESGNEEKKEESKDEDNAVTEEGVEKSVPVQTEVSSTEKGEVEKEPFDTLTGGADESKTNSSPIASPQTEASEPFSPSSTPETESEARAVEADEQTNDREVHGKEPQMITEAKPSALADSAPELEKLKMEMKMMETALQGAARQAQVVYWPF